MGFEAFIQPHPHHPLGCQHRQRCIGGNFLGHGPSLGSDLVGRNHMVGEALGQAIGRAERAAGEDDFRRLGPAEHARQEPGAAAFRHDPTLDEGGGQLGIVGHDADIAAQREVHAITRGRAIERADHRLVHREEDRRRRVAQVDRGRKLAIGTADPLARRCLVKVKTSAERPACPGQDDHPDLRVLIHRHQRPRQLVEHGRGDGVHPLGPVQRDGGDVVGNLADQGAHVVQIRSMMTAGAMPPAAHMVTRP